MILIENVALIDSLAGRWPPPGGPSWLDHLSLAISPWHYRRYQEFHLKACNDLERSRRVLQLLFANWLPQADRPASQRHPWRSHTPTLVYAADPSAPPSARALPPEALNTALDHYDPCPLRGTRQRAEQEGKSFLHSRSSGKETAISHEKAAAAQP